MSTTRQQLQIQLEVNETLIRHTTRDGIGLALAGVINKLVPFQFFLHAIWSPHSPVGYRISSVKTPDGRFQIFEDKALFKLMIENREAVLKSGRFLSQKENAGVYQGDALKEMAERFPSFHIGYHVHGIRSTMIFNMQHTNGYNNFFVISDTREHAFTQEDFQMITALLPQVQLAFDNLFKYEELRKQEQERKLQLVIMTAFTAFDGRKNLDEMALEAISKFCEFIPFEYWLTITKIAPVADKYFRIAYKKEGKFCILDSNEVFKKIQHAPIHPASFKEENLSLYDTPRLFVGEEMAALVSSNAYFNACHKHLNLNSLITMPVTVLGKAETLYMLGSVRQYAFTLDDLQMVTRILPYLSMGGQQFFFLLQIQSLTKQLEMEKNYLVEEIKSSYNFDEIIGESTLMKDVFRQISQVAPTDSTVLILGETGTGKELIARAIHNQSPRKDKVLVKVNCASLPAQLIESELFGHEKGSFTGALEKRIGKFELANGGTIFLDEIGELPLELQAKLLRVLQEREIERIGGKAPITLNVRIIAATNRDLETEVAEGRFRSDLYYRLSVFPIHLPPLRERKEDIPMLVTHFLQKYCKKMAKPFRYLKEDTVKVLLQYEWPGNIRELENIMEQTVIIGEESASRLRKSNSIKKITPSLPKSIISEASQSEADIVRVLTETKGKILGMGGAARILNLRPAEIEIHERRWILEYLKKTGGRIRGENGAAQLIGINPTTLEARVKKLRITKSEIFTLASD